MGSDSRASAPFWPAHLARARTSGLWRQIRFSGGPAFTSILLALLIAAFVTRCEFELQPTVVHDSTFVELVSRELIQKSNYGREILRGDGFFAIPEGVTRIWVDVGAHHLETTRHALEENPDLGLVAVEPLAECWKAWPNDERIIGVPIALSLERGWQDFHVNRLDASSSLLASDPGPATIPLTDIATQTVEVRPVPVLRLEDVLERIPPELDIEFLKTDVQGLDLQVLKSAGDHLRRVGKVKAEVIVKNEGHYFATGEYVPGKEEEFTTYMKSMGFVFSHDVGTASQRAWLDKIYVNMATRNQPIAEK